MMYNDKKALSTSNSPQKTSMSLPSTPGKQRSPKKCQFMTPTHSERSTTPESTGSPAPTSKIDKCTTWLCRRGATATEEEEVKSVPVSLDGSRSETPGPSSSPIIGACEDATPPPKNCFRLVMLGSARVGKTSLVARFLGNRFDDSYTPTIEDFHRKLYRIRGEIYQLDLLDTSGNHPFPAMRRLSFLTGDLFVLVFSMESRESFDEVVRLREQILETKAGAAGTTGTGRSRRAAPPPRVPMAIAGNKCDKESRSVHPEEASTYCATQDGTCIFVETSAKKNFHVDDLFYELFLVANLPLEMAPNHHKRVNTAFGSPCALPPAGTQTNRSKKCTLSIKRRLSDACGVVAPNVRRPSIRTDLMIMRTKTCAKGESDSVSGSPKNKNINRRVRPNGTTTSQNSHRKTCVIQ